MTTKSVTKTAFDNSLVDSFSQKEKEEIERRAAIRQLATKNAFLNRKGARDDFFDYWTVEVYCGDHDWERLKDEDGETKMYEFDDALDLFLENCEKYPPGLLRLFRHAQSSMLSNVQGFKGFMLMRDLNEVADEFWAKAEAK